MDYKTIFFFQKSLYSHKSSIRQDEKTALPTLLYAILFGFKQISKGNNNGIKVNQAVVAKDGLVGYISSVEEYTATVTTILDPSSSVSVKISGVNEPSILKGDLDLKSSNKLKLEFIELDASISISDILYTSGLGSLYPASIPIGKIIEIKNSKNDIDRYAIVEPNVNITTISEVGVIKN